MTTTRTRPAPRRPEGPPRRRNPRPLTGPGRHGWRRLSGPAGNRALNVFRGRALRSTPGPARALAELGAATAEYAMILVAAAAFSTLLIKIISSGAVKGLLTGIVTRALT
jgi:uncharacterized protein DUF4244